MQDLVAISIAVLAGLFLVRQAWLRLTRQGKSTCGTCHGCGSKEAIVSRPLVRISLDSIRR